MSVQDEILGHLQRGLSPREIIAMGFSKSTVYKVNESFQVYSGAVTKPAWTIENIHYDRGNQPRYQPGNSITMNFNLRNCADRDFYVVNIGIQTEWMVPLGQWQAINIRQIIRPNQRRYVQLTFQVPTDVQYGEYELLFGVEGQYLPVQGYQDQLLTTQWSDPQILHIKKPLIGLTAFISHSVSDRHRVAVLEKTLDNYGIHPIIGEDVFAPGAVLEQKFKNLVDSCNVFIALLTDAAARSKWVMMETNYALQRNKRCILLKEKSVDLKSNIQWIEFSHADCDEVIITKVMDAIRVVQTENNNNATGALLIGILAALVGVGLASRR